MPIVWRLTPPAFAYSLDGAGNRVTGARWNSPGRRGVVYTCANLSLCVLETYVHIPPSLRLTLPDFEAVRIDIPDNAPATQITIPELERLLSMPDPESACRAIGDQWLARGTELILAAPSVVVPEESNIMLNPAHPSMRKVTILSTQRFQFDQRLASSAWKREP
jgi:RES domain-containing protein